MTDLIAKHGGYQNLKSFQMTVIIYDLTVEFCKLYVPSFKMRDQLEGAARSGSQNIGEGSDNSGTSKHTELRLVNIAKGSLKELKLDMEAFLRQNNLSVWSKDDPRALEIRKLAYKSDKSYKTYSSYLSAPETAANCLLCLINQACFLLDKQLKALERDLKLKGDYKDRVQNLKKDSIVRNDEMNYDEFLKQFNLKRNENGTVSNINEL